MTDLTGKWGDVKEGEGKGWGEGGEGGGRGGMYTQTVVIARRVLSSCVQYSVKSVRDWVEWRSEHA